MDLHVLVIVHTLPLWFLVFSLFLPRIALLLLWLEGGAGAVPSAWDRAAGVCGAAAAGADFVPDLYGYGDWALVCDSPGGGIDGVGVVRVGITRGGDVGRITRERALAGLVFCREEI